MPNFWNIFGDSNMGNCGLMVYGTFNVTADKIKTKFSEYGTIVQFNFLSSEQMCYIQFRRADEVQRAILQSPKCFYIAKHDSVFQPESANGMASTLDVLNCDVIIGITQYISLLDRINLSIAFPQFRYALRYYAEKELTDMELDDLSFLGPIETFHLFKVVGSCIKSIETDVPVQTMDTPFLAKCISYYCTECERLTVKYDEAIYSFFRHVVPNMTCLKELNLLDCLIQEHDLINIPNKKLVKKLTITGNCNVTGDWLEVFTGLEHLNLSGCGLRLHPIKGAIKGMHELRSIHLCDTSLSNDFFKILMRQSPKIEELNFSYTPTMRYAEFHLYPSLKSLTCTEWRYRMHEKPNRLNHKLLINYAKSQRTTITSLRILIGNDLRSSCITMIARIRSLRVLIIPEQSYLTDPMLWRLAQLPNLEELNISKCRGLTSLGIATFCERCTTLRILEISYSVIHQDFLEHMRTAMRLRQLADAPKLTIFAYGRPPASAIPEVQEGLVLRFDNSRRDSHSTRFDESIINPFAGMINVPHDCALCEKEI